MPIEGWLTLLVISVAVVAMVKEWLEVPLALGGALGVLMLTGMLTPATALAGFSNPAVATVALLLVIAGRLERGPWFGWLSNLVFGSRPGRRALVRSGISVGAVSAFMANTAVVAVLIPATRAWAERHGESASRLLMPLSFAAIMGGACTLIGTSTNLVVHGMLVDSGDRGLGMFELARLAAPLGLLGVAYIAAIGYRTLPARVQVLDAVQHDPREYVTELRVGTESPFVGKRVRDLRNLDEVYVAGIERSGELVSPVSPEQTIEAGDALILVGRVDDITELSATLGTKLVTSAGAAPHLTDDLDLVCEVVVSPSAPMVGRGVRESGFRGRYDAVVLAVHRHGERLEKKIGDIVLRAGDTLLLRTGPDFPKRWRHARDFYLVSTTGAAPPRPRASDWVEPAVLLAVVLVTTTGFLSLLDASVMGVIVLIGTGRLKTRRLWASLDWSTLMTMATAIGLGGALVETGAASAMAHAIVVGTAATSTVWVASAVFVAAALLTEIITNVAAAALLFPVAMAAAVETGVPIHTLAVAIAVGASISFLSPIGYQTNTMVAGAAGYSLGDFVRLGLPLKVLYVTAGSVAIPWLWKGVGP